MSARGVPLTVPELRPYLSWRDRNRFRCRISRCGRSHILWVIDALGFDRDHDLVTAPYLLFLKCILCSSVLASALGIHANRLTNLCADWPFLRNNEDRHQNHPVTHQVTFCYIPDCSLPVPRLHHEVSLTSSLVACSAVSRGPG